jgi:hypothetical protein
MRKVLFGLLVVGLVVPAAWAADPIYIDLQPKTNQKRDEAFSKNYENNDLSVLPEGVEEFDGVKFKIGKGLIVVGGKRNMTKPEKVEGIEVGKPFAKLHLLQATQYGNSGDDDENPNGVKDGIEIGEYKVHYEDKTTETIPVVYGKHVRDWWNFDDGKDVSDAKLAWTGTNPAAEMFNVKIRLYKTTWTNPRPDKKVTHIDFVSKMTNCAPFVVAMTAEGK